MNSEEDLSSSSNLFESIQEEFKSFSDGSVRDSLGHLNSVWKIIDFHRWWLSFESHAGVPLGRKLMNAATDQEEHFLNESSLLDIGWFMKKKRIDSTLHQRWQKRGWGRYSLSSNTVYSHLLAPLCSGFALAALEIIKSQRLKVQWRQVSNIQIQLETDEDPRSISLAPSPPLFFWDSNQQSGQHSQEHDITLDLQIIEHGWTHSGEPSFLIPLGVFQRLFGSVSMQGIQLPSEVLDCWDFSEDINLSQVIPLILTSLALNDMVSQSERPIYIQDLNSWSQLSDAYLKPFGLGSFISVNAVDEQGGVEFELFQSSLLPLTLGFLIAFWQRGIGRKAKIEIKSTDGNFIVKITSFLSYAE